MSKTVAKNTASATPVRSPGTRLPSRPSAPSKQLAVFDNPNPERDYQIHIQIPEFTCLCPLTGQPDFARFTLDYIPDRRCVELKSLKMYMWSYRDEGAFHEKVTNTILSDIVRTTKPRYARLIAHWNVRGGLYTNVVVEHRQKNWKGAGELLAFDPADAAA